MKGWILISILLFLLLVLWNIREHYVEISGPGNRPEKTAEWLSKIDATAPIGGNDDDYLRVLQAFYDKKWKPLRDANPTASIRDTEVEAFLQGPDGKVPGVDINALRKVIAAGFSIERTESAAAREERQAVKTGALAGFVGGNLQPKDGVDQVYPRKEAIYTPVDTRIGELPEGIYPDVFQQPEPRREGDVEEKSTSWTKTSFSSV